MIAATAVAILVEVIGVRAGGSLAWPAALPTAIALAALAIAWRSRSGWTMPATIAAAAAIGAVLGVATG